MNTIASHPGLLSAFAELQFENRSRYDFGGYRTCRNCRGVGDP